MLVQIEIISLSMLVRKKGKKERKNKRKEKTVTKHAQPSPLPFKHIFTNKIRGKCNNLPQKSQIPPVY